MSDNADRCSCGVTKGNARKVITWLPNKKLRAFTATLSRYRSVSVALGRKAKSSDKVWAVTFKGKTAVLGLAIRAETMDALIACVRQIEREERLLSDGWQALTEMKWVASVIEAPSGGETTKIGSTEGESAVGATSAETPNAPHRSTGE